MGADQRIQATEDAVGAGHATKADSLNRLGLVEHNNDGTHENAVGQCRLTKNGANLQLDPYDGNQLTINGARETVPSAGVTLAATGLTIDTDHFIYAYMVSGVMTLEASTTGHATDSSTGVEIKTGDATRTLVGMGRPITGPAWVDSATEIYVLSWFNKRPKRGIATDTARRTTTSTTYVEMTTVLQVNFLTWANETVRFIPGGSFSSTTSTRVLTTMSVNNTTDLRGSSSSGISTSEGRPGGAYEGTETEGKHTSKLLGKVASAGPTLNLLGDIVDTTTQVIVKG